jgi:hypothetical protein
LEQRTQSAQRNVLGYAAKARCETLLKKKLLVASLQLQLPFEVPGGFHWLIIKV